MESNVPLESTSIVSVQDARIPCPVDSNLPICVFEPSHGLRPEWKLAKPSLRLRHSTFFYTLLIQKRKWVTTKQRLLYTQENTIDSVHLVHLIWSEPSRMFHVNKNHSSLTHRGATSAAPWLKKISVIASFDDILIKFISHKSLTTPGTHTVEPVPPSVNCLI